MERINQRLFDFAIKKSFLFINSISILFVSAVFICQCLNILSEFILKKLKNARYKLLKDGSYFGEISGLKGVWANANNLEDCRKELQEVLEDWLLLKVRECENIPGFRLKIGKRGSVRYV